MISHRKKIQHLFLRAGFGIKPSVLDEMESKSIEELVELIFIKSSEAKDIKLLDPPDTNSKGEATNASLLAALLKSQDELKQLNMAWMGRMTSTEAILLEKMTLFWHNHFACTAPFAILMQRQNNMLRKNALGNFKTLINQISKDPAMILYLNNQENHKDSPNENFAREVMELFTLGIGNYSETDIKEAARAFTGWSVNKSGEFEFHEHDHDDGIKEIFGQSGNWNGDDVITMLLQKPQTAFHICKKLYKEFVNEKTNDTVVQLMADKFFESDYDITGLMKYLFNSDWFYDEINVGSKISSPVEFIVRLKREIDLRFEDYKQQASYQKVLGQVLFFPPNVAGWKGGRNWIDSSSLLYRLNLAKVIAGQSNFELQPKPEFEEQENFQIQKIKLDADLKPVVNYFLKTDANKMEDSISDSYIQTPEIISDFSLAANTMLATTDFQKTLNTLVAVLSSPEFQLI